MNDVVKIIFYNVEIACFVRTPTFEVLQIYTVFMVHSSTGNKPTNANDDADEYQLYPALPSATPPRCACQQRIKNRRNHDNVDRRVPRRQRTRQPPERKPPLPLLQSTDSLRTIGELSDAIWELSFSLYAEWSVGRSSLLSAQSSQ
mmetsp:Transcript_11612/g.24446  ORF Transcript_11612/g.24446 Transcript_11612/m.24446 type:complete len:146 (-) Transcript_11612:478-915(-)